MPYSLSGYYTPGMSYDAAQAVAAKLPAEERAAMMAKAAAALPDCYSEKLHRCIRELPGDTVANCDDIQEGYVANWDGMSKLIEEMPYCSEPVRVPYLVAGAVTAFALGIGVGMLVAR